MGDCGRVRPCRSHWHGLGCFAFLWVVSMKNPSRIKTCNGRLAHAWWALVAIVGCTLIGAISYLILGLV